MNALASLKQVRWLDLGGTRITDRGLVEMKEMSRLKMLIVRRTQVTDAGVAELQRMQPQLEIVR